MVEKSAFAALAICLGVLLMAAWHQPPYSPDSWAYFELSNSFWTDYGVNHLRAFGTTVEQHSTAFPPLWPFVWWLLANVTGLGARAGLVAAFLLTFALGLVSEAIGRHLGRARFVGLAAVCFVLSTPGYFSEVVAARAIPLQVLIVAFALLMLLKRPRPNLVDATLLGALTGAAVLTRFDMLPFAIVLGLAVSLLGRSLLALAAFVAGALIALLPWMIATIAWHDSILTSDNAAVALSADPTAYLTDWYPPGSLRPTIVTDPMAWLSKVVAHMGPVVASLFKSPSKHGVVVLIGIALCLVWQWLRLRRAERRVGLSADAPVLTAVLVAALAMVPLYVVLGYPDRRYFSLLIWIVAIWMFALTAKICVRTIGIAVVERAALALAGLLLAWTLYSNVPQLRLAPSDAAFPEAPEYAELTRCLPERRTGDGARMLVTDATLAARLSAVHGMRTSFLPRNFALSRTSEKDLALFLRTFNIDVLAGDAALIEQLFPPALRQHIAGDCGIALYGVPKVGDR